MFLADSSGLDILNNELWAVDNGTATIWKMNIDEKGIPTFAKGFEKGKKVVFIKDKDATNPASPDAEGITLDGNGNVYLAVERDNGNKAVNKNMILQVSPNVEAEKLIPNVEWDVTDIIDNARKERGVTNYKVQNNYGIETIEWIPNSKLAGKLFDQNTNDVYNPTNYTSISNGLFFTGLEDDGYIYVFALEENGNKTLITQIDSGMGMVMGLDYDEKENRLWALSDNGRDNTLATITLNGTKNPDVTYHLPPASLNLKENNEGFAIGNVVVDGYRLVYWFMDGVKQNALKLGWVQAEKEDGILTFDLGGGLLNGSTEPVILKNKVGDEITIIDAPTKEGYEFLYWEGSQYLPGDKYVVVGNHKFTAKWKEVKVEKDQVSAKKKSPDTSDSGIISYFGLASMALLGVILTKKIKK